TIENNNVIQLKTPINEGAVSKMDTKNPINTHKYASYYYWKGKIDKLFALMGLIISSPILLLVSVLIKVDSRGPILFKQERIGVHSKPFKIYKFRTMKINAPNIPT